MKAKTEADLPFGAKFQAALAAKGWTWEDYVAKCQQHSNPPQLKEVLQEDARRRRERAQSRYY